MSSDNITVAIKVRPLIKREQDERLPIQWIMGEHSITQIDPETNKRCESEFHFDYIFDMDKTNQNVFDGIAKPIVDAAMKGFNGTIFAYGQTGSGKTYTMMGTQTEKGVIPLVVNYIFDYIQNDPDKEFLLRVSYIEIYNEKINDLIDTSRSELRIKEDSHGNISVNCKEEVGTTPQSVLALMKKGDKNRRTGETNMNERSSRSHTIFRITIESCDKSDPDTTTKESQLNLIDLAGSERARNTGATGERFNEGCNINKSLSALGLVIRQLSEAQSSTKYINFRDSKLTRILQPSLGGNALTTVICAVTPAASDETQCTLNFALRAKGVKNKPTVNETVSDKALLKRVRSQATEIEAAMKRMETELKEKDREILQFRIKFLNTQIISRNKNEDPKTQARRRRTWAGSRFSTFHPEPFELPPISENEVQPSISMVSFTKNQQTFLNELDLNQTFGPAFTDFELQLLQDQREKDNMNSFSGFNDVSPIPFHRVTVRDVDADHDESDKTSDNETTPTTQCITLKSILPRTPIKSLRNDVLRELTTPERQLIRDDCNAHTNHGDCEKNMAFVAKSPTDTEQLCKDLNKKFTELQSGHSILSIRHEATVKECQSLHREVESLKPLQNTVSSLEVEKNDYQVKYNETMTKLRKLEEEISTHDLEMDMVKTKHKAREKELEANAASLEAQLIPASLKIPKLENQLTFIQSEKEEQEKVIVSLRKDINEKQLELEKRQANVSEVNNLNNYVASLRSFMKDIQKENEELKKEMENVNNSIKILEGEKKSLLIELENARKSNERLSSIEIDHDKTLDDKSILLSETVPPISETESSTEKSPNFEKKENALSDEKEISSIFANGSYFDNMSVSATYDTTESLLLQDTFQRSANTTRTMQLEESKNILDVTSDEFMNGLNDKTTQELTAILEEHCVRRSSVTIENEHIKLADITKEFEGMALVARKLRQTVIQLTNENEDMTSKLDIEKEKSSVLGRQLEMLITETQTQQVALEGLQKELEEQKQIIAEVKNQELDKLVEVYKSQVASLIAENERLSSEIMDKVKELDNIKSKSLLIEHDSSYREKLDNLIERIKHLESENMDLLEMNKSRSFNKFSHNKLDLTKSLIENVNNHSNRLQDHKLVSNMTVLENEVKELKILNAKLTDLKLTTCLQCARVGELSSTRHALKKEITIVNRKLAELQSRFEKECADVEILNHKVKKEMNCSLLEETINTSVFDGINASILEEEVQRLHTKLESLSTLYQDKCEEVEKLKDSIHETSQPLVASSPKPNRRNARIERFQKELIKYKEDMQMMMKTLNGVSSSLKKFKDQEMSMQNEIGILKAANVLLEEKLQRTESLASNTQEVSRRCGELENINARFEKKMRSSTSKSQSDTEQLNAPFDMVCHEHNEIKANLSFYKAKLTSADALDSCDKYDNLLQEKNQIALELEAKSSANLQLESTIKELEKNIAMLDGKNKDLDEELDDLVKKIHDQDTENTALQVRLQDLEATHNASNNQNSDLDIFKKDYAEMKIKLDSVTTEIELLRIENAEYKSKLQERRSSTGSASPSPTHSTKSCQRRNSTLNENRRLEGSEDLPEGKTQCQCSNLKKRIMKLEQDLAIKDAKVVAQNMEFEHKTYSLKKKCHNYEEYLAVYAKKHQSLTSELTKLQKMKGDCEKSMNLTTNKRVFSISTQTDDRPEQLGMFGNNSSNSVVAGIGAYEIKLATLERSKQNYKEKYMQCQSDLRDLKEKLKDCQYQLEKYQQKIKELSDQSNIQSSAHSHDSYLRNLMTANMPTNLLGIATTTTTKVV